MGRLEKRQDTSIEYPLHPRRGLTALRAALSPTAVIIGATPYTIKGTKFLTARWDAIVESAYLKNVVLEFLESSTGEWETSERNIFVLHSPPDNVDTMSEPNNMNNNYIGHYNNICQSTYPEDVNSDDANTHVASFSLSDNVDVTSIAMNSMVYKDTGDYTGNYASYQGNPSVSYYTHINGQLNSPNPDQAEAHANSSCPLPGSFQTFCGSTNLYSDAMNDDGSTDNRFGMDNNSSTSYIFTLDPTGTGYVVTKVEHTQLVLGRMSAADFNQMLATTRT
ncbi:4854_t:CDS:2 [Paraglomus brasilianum]|uniref:4854_t:CDS:1 n=1 Tax=Paraglomus brasilianum TaxID=144538 RepID=A0A9N9AII4_9GLOM|nr:4854_t:CDS:2 [Paraglomus brasilianum]